MDSTTIHTCLETAEAPTHGTDVEVGSHWVCACGDDFVFRGGFNRGGGSTIDWFPAPPVAGVRVPRQRTSLGSLLFHPRKG